MDILLLACYELGHQPLSLAWPLASLREEGHTVRALDLAVESFDPSAASAASLVGIAVPMHTAMRLGVEAARQVRTANPQAHICFYGLYAWLNADYLLTASNGHRPLADSVIAGEFEAPLLGLARALNQGKEATSVPGVSAVGRRDGAHLERLAFPVPDRADLPPLSQYAHYMYNGTVAPAGYVEASRGCLHTCRHCPVVPVYGGRFFVVPVETVMADVRQQVEAGAQHITFGDPDFLNGPGHALNVARALHEEFPAVTFDFTTKVEHIRERQELFAEFRELGATFVVSAFEAVSERVLQQLKKDHTVADMEAALDILDAAGLHVQPTWVPFTPWTTMDDYLALLAWIREHRLIQHVPAVQLSIRLLIPPKSALLDEVETAGWLGPLDAENFTYRWQHPDPRMDTLQQAVADLVEEAGNEDPYRTFAAIERLAYGTAGRPAPRWQAPLVPDPPPPRLTEDWFC